MSVMWFDWRNLWAHYSGRADESTAGAEDYGGTGTEGGGRLRPGPVSAGETPEKGTPISSREILQLWYRKPCTIITEYSYNVLITLQVQRKLAELKLAPGLSELFDQFIWKCQV